MGEALARARGVDLAHRWKGGQVRTCEARMCPGFGVEPATVEMLSPLHELDGFGPGWFAICAKCEPTFVHLDSLSRSRYLSLGDPRAVRESFRPILHGKDPPR